jgi:hypothetical protein
MKLAAVAAAMKRVKVLISDMVSRAFPHQLQRVHTGKLDIARKHRFRAPNVRPGG